jgi:hypothetical protein
MCSLQRECVKRARLIQSELGSFLHDVRNTAQKVLIDSLKKSLDKLYNVENYVKVVVSNLSAQRSV